MLTAFGATPTAGVQCSSLGRLALRRIKTPKKNEEAHVAVEISELKHDFG